MWTARWPSIQGEVLPHQKLKLRMRASPIRAAYGRTFWSEEVHLDAVGGAAVVTLPAPMEGVGVPIQDSVAGYVVSVTALQVSKPHKPLVVSQCRGATMSGAQTKALSLLSSC